MDHLLLVDGKTACAAQQTNLPQQKMLEREHLQEWVIANPQMLGEDVLIVTSEFDRWEADSDGTPARDRLDILGLDGSGRLVVVELKRGAAERDIHLQSITYAALVSRFDFDTLAEAHRAFLRSRGHEVDTDHCKEAIRTHVDGDLDPEVLRQPRQVLIAASFPKQVTHTVVWLSELSVDIELIQVNSWIVGEQLVAGFTKVYPTPQAEEFTLGPARAEAKAVVQKAQAKTRAKNAVHKLIESAVLPAGTALRIVPTHGTTEQLRETINAWLSEDDQRETAAWMNQRPKALQWAYDGQLYTPTGLAEKVFVEAVGSTAEGIQGTRWLVVDAALSNSVVSTAWEELDGKDLAQLASTVQEGGRDWSDLHHIVEAIQAGHWASYGDLAAAIGSHPNPVGQHLARCQSCANPWRVLTSEARVSKGFKWRPDLERPETPQQVLEAEGIRFTNGAADSSRRLNRADLQVLL